MGCGLDGEIWGRGTVDVQMVSFRGAELGGRIGWLGEVVLSSPFPRIPCLLWTNRIWETFGKVVGMNL